MAHHVTPPSLLILGTDAVLAASPATPVQLAHACQAAGYRSVVPASWGDEILARRVLSVVENTNTPLVLCVCPLVTRRLGRHAADIGSMTLCAVAPPVATAAYLRALYAPASVRITFAGTCQAGGHASIDAWLTPDELLADLADKGFQLGDQPTEFDSILPPDRRRHFSDPGGAPAPEALRRAGGAPELIELGANDFVIDLAQELLAGGRRLVDAGPALGCACSGAAPGVPAHAARARVRAGEPPRAPSPIVDHDIELPLDIIGPQCVEHGTASKASQHDATPVTARPADVTARTLAAFEPSELAATAVAAPALPAPPAPPAPPESTRRRSPTGNSRSVLGAMPQSRSSGRQLPRAYVARRRSSPKGVRQSGVRRQIDLAGPFREERAVPRWVWLAAAAVAIVVAAAVLLRIL